MDIFMPMSTKLRHNEIITALIIKIANLIERQAVRVFHEEGSLVYHGKRQEAQFISLVHIEKLEDIDFFKNNVMNELYFVQPDFVLFKQNDYIENTNRTRLAGCPDLVIEIWSDGNTNDEKAFKKFLYSTSDKTEHWYIEQDSNEVQCFLGQNSLPAQSLLNVLRTTNGIEFDLRRMAITD